MNFAKEKSRLILPLVAEKLREYEIEPYIPDDTEMNFVPRGVKTGSFCELTEKCDIFITIGGDGTILKWGKIAAKAGKKLLGINTGRLGFMATLESDELKKLSRLKNNDYKISRRMMMNVTLNGDELNGYTALNDVVLYKSTCSKLPEFRVLGNNVQVTKIRADGIIFSTPTGSTAYALAAGGPIIEPELECIEFTPLCAHTLFNRPMIFSGGNTISVKFHSYENTQVFLSIDGSDGVRLTDDDTLTIKKSALALNLIDLDGDNFYNSVNNKLMQPLK